MEGRAQVQCTNQESLGSWIYLYIYRYNIGRMDGEAEAPILWPPDVNSWLIGKDSDAGKDWGQEEKGAAEDETIGWHHHFNGQELEPTPGDGEGSLACCSSWGHKVRHDLQLNNNNKKYITYLFKKGFIVRNWLTQLWSPRSPMMCQL